MSGAGKVEGGGGGGRVASGGTVSVRSVGCEILCRFRGKGLLPAIPGGQGWVRKVLVF